MQRLAERDDVRHLRRRDVEDAGFLVERRAAPVATTVRPGYEQQSLRRFGIAEEHGRCVDRTELVAADNLLRFRLQLRREVDQIGLGDTLLIEGRWLRRNRLRRRIPLAWHVALRHGALVN